ncbi:PREDICTED: uncharacterized protein LOC108354128 isoform X2 [Rhagoletis zephyria]|uniref:uncharacterized protein LOC108354128 isoform X2 n=1 Tax=Rhagoletis zephyria TaxID=28612 RepID=UPI0008115D57|nr:PREDICTED: uncharacterized protein LOC108354128 isoform X2 [Rhagoletis zephyria]XP_036331156.1 uncharacterized protein LOC118742860 isoform X2 [Rhagoletis pomonella]
MDRRKKRTSTNQYMMYLDMMEKDCIFATGRIPRDVESNYLHKKWKELSDKLNMCGSGPTLTAEEWRKRLNDWKNTTRCKYRRSISGEKDVSLTSLELKALDLFGKVPGTGSEPRPSESLQKELQAAVEEAIYGDDDDDAMQGESEEHEDIITHTIPNNVQTTVSTTTGGANVGTTTTYRTIVVENAALTDDDQNQDHLEFITQRRHTLGPSSTSTNVVATGVQTVVTAATPSQATATKLINGEMPLKRLRTKPPSDQVIYEVKKAPISHAPRTITIHNTGVSQAECNTIPSNSSHNTSTHLMGLSAVPTHDAREIARQLKRIADIKAEKLKFEIARFKFNNPGFVYHSSTL